MNTDPLTLKKLNKVQKDNIKKMLSSISSIDELKNLDAYWNGEKGTKYVIAAKIIKMTPIIGKNVVRVLLMHNGIKVDGDEELDSIINNEDRLSQEERKTLKNQLENYLRSSSLVIDSIKGNEEVFAGTMLGDVLGYQLESTSVLSELESVPFEGEMILGNASETNSSIEEMAPKKKDESKLGTIAKEIAKGTAAGAAPGVLTGNPEGAAVGAIIGAVGGAAIGVGNVISDVLSGDANVEQTSEIVEEPIILSDQERKDLEMMNAGLKQLYENGDDLEKVLEESGIGLPELAAIDMVLKESVEESEMKDELDHVLDNINTELPDLKDVDMVVNGQLINGLEEDSKLSDPMESFTRGKRPGYYKNPIHADALGLFFGSSVNPNWNNALFFDRSQVLNEGDIERNKKYYYDQSISLVNKYGVDFLVPALKYNKDSSWKDIIKENHEILQLYFKLKGIVPVETKPVPEIIKSLVNTEQKDSFEESVNVEDYQSGHDTKIENDRYNPFRVVSNNLSLDPKDAYDTRLLGNGIPIEARKTFRGDPQVLNNIVVRDLKKSSIKGQLPVTSNKKTVVPVTNSQMRLADDSELCASLFKFNY